MTRASQPPTPLPHRPSAIELLDEAARRAPGERGAYLDERCAGDAALRAEVESLLSHLEASPDFLQRPPVDSGPALSGLLPPGTRVLRYRIERVLGEGGMGVVYLARQEHPDRPVALKLIRPVAASPALIRRFAREAEMLGRLQHPGIAQIFEAGAADLGGGLPQPFLAMELVDGVPLTEYARTHALSAGQRLALVARLCEAVEHAHQRGLIHRDLKPANILVTDAGDPKILDFGVARAVDAAAPGATLATDAGVLIGTLAYMSPEQVEARDRESLDTRSDIYALGVILYELLCGRLPHETGGLSLLDAARVIRDRDPARPGSLVRALRGDVETIILTAMARDRERRYPSAGALREDIRRCLAGEPIAARRDSALYVLRKSLRRYRWGVAAAAVFVALLAGFGAWSAVQARAFRLLADKESQARTEIAARERQAAEQLRVSNLERGRMLALAGDLRGAERALWGAFAARPGAPDAAWALRELYLRFPLLGTLDAGEGEVFSARFSPDGALIASAGDRGLVHLWDAPTGALLRTLHGHTDRLNCVRFSPDGTLLASGGLDSIIRLWNVRDGSPAGALVGHENSMHEFVFSADGARIYSTGQDGTLRLWDVPARALLREARVRPTGWAVRLHPASPGIVIHTDFEGHVYVRDAESLDLLQEFRAHAGIAHCAAFSPDGALLATGGRDTTVALWSAADWSPIARADPGIGSVRAVEFSPDGALIVATGTRTTVVLDARTLRPAAPALPDFRGGWCAQFSPDGRSLLTTAQGPGVARHWSVGAYPGAASVAAHTGTILALAASGDGALLASGATDGTYALRDTRTGEELQRWTTRSPPRALAFSPDARWLASAHANGHVRLHPLDAPNDIIAYRDHTASIESLVYLPDGRLAAGAADGAIRVWHPPADAPASVLEAGSAVAGLAASPDGRWLAANTADRLAMVWDASTLTLVAEGVDRAGSNIRSILFMPDSRRLVMPSVSGPIEIWDALTSRPLDQLNGHTRYVVRAALTGGALASAGQDGLLNLWDLDGARCLASLPTGELAVQNMVWLPGGTRFVLSCTEGRLVFIDLAPLDARLEALARARPPTTAAPPAPTTPGESAPESSADFGGVGVNRRG